MMMIVCITVLLVLIGIRFYLSYQDISKKDKPNEGTMDNVGICQATGDMEVQSDHIEVITNEAGRLAILCDGVGKENTGAVSAKIAADAFKQLFSQYKSLHNPTYFLKRGFYLANQNIQKAIGDRRGGASVAVVYMNRKMMCYALAGDIKAAILRNDELIPLSEGHTIDVLAKQAYQKGKLTKQETLWALKEERIWNYVGMEGFREIEIFDTPIALKPGDVIVLLSKGIYKVLPWVELEDILRDNSSSAKEKADQIVIKTEQITTSEKDNASVIVVETSGWVQ